MRWAVVLAGGAGTRFWPASTRRRPKQLLALAGGDETLLAATVRRLTPLVPAERLLIATGAHLVEATAAAVPHVPEANLLAEPVARNTAPCIAWATRVVARRDPDAVVGVFPADHAVTDEAAFAATLLRAYETAETGPITTIGLTPTRAETGFGYIELGARVSNDARRVERFVEKPDRARAEAFVKGGKHLWNGGMFFFRAAVMNRAVATHMPQLAGLCDDLDAAAGGADEPRALARLFDEATPISIDHGVMEKEPGLAVVPGDFGWSDVGSWEAAWELADKDEHGNATGTADVVAIGSSRNLVRDLRPGAPAEVVALVGVDDLVVVRTEGALLVMRRSASQDVKLVTEALAGRAKP